MSNYVVQAEKVILGTRIFTQKLTTSQIRKLLAMSNELYNKAMLSETSNLSDEIQDRISYVRMRIAYEAGRSEVLREFVKKAEIVEQLNSIGADKKELVTFCRYMESLVAFHKYYGGNE